MKTIIIGLMLVFGASACQAQKAEPCVQKYITYPKLNESEFDALVDFTFNVGCGALKQSTLRRMVNQGNIQGAADQFLRWTYVGKKQVPGLLKRRMDERNLFLQPVKAFY
jgi:lysozyme